MATLQILGYLNVLITHVNVIQGKDEILEKLDTIKEK